MSGRLPGLLVHVGIFSGWDSTVPIWKPDPIRWNGDWGILPSVVVQSSLLGMPVVDLGSQANSGRPTWCPGAEVEFNLRASGMSKRKGGTTQRLPVRPSMTRSFLIAVESGLAWLGLAWDSGKSGAGVR
jgi:hypothetical protein